MTFDIRERMDSWEKANRRPEYTSEFLKGHGDGGKECGCPVNAALNSMKEEAEATALYNARANTVDDAHSREVYRDIAKEEAVHLGEAAELLKETDPELAEKVPEGMQEASKGEWDDHVSAALKSN